MILSINPTRMELLKLKRRVAIARRGHKLLKDKQDELMRRFLAMIEKTRSLRKEIEKEFKEVLRSFIKARSVNSPVFIDAQIARTNSSLEVILSKERFLNLELLNFGIKELPEEARYSFIGTSSHLDAAVRGFNKLLPQMIELAGFEIKIKLIAEEIKKTRRRVNALEYIFIPNLLDTVAYISMKLTELERSNLVRLMRVKEMLEEAR